LGGIRNGLRSCIAAGIALKELQQAVKDVTPGDDVKINVEIPTPDKAHHVWWLIPRITRVGG
jgi:hypothetical protein